MLSLSKRSKVGPFSKNISLLPCPVVIVAIADTSLPKSRFCHYHSTTFSHDYHWPCSAATMVLHLTVSFLLCIIQVIAEVNALSLSKDPSLGETETLVGTEEKNVLLVDGSLIGPTDSQPRNQYEVNSVSGQTFQGGWLWRAPRCCKFEKLFRFLPRRRRQPPDSWVSRYDRQNPLASQGPRLKTPQWLLVQLCWP